MSAIPIRIPREIPPELIECGCLHLSRTTRHGKIIREAYERAVVQIIESFSVCPESAAFGVANVAVIGSGGLYQDYQWLDMLFENGRYPGTINLHLVDRLYAPIEESVDDALKEAKHTAQISLRAFKAAFAKEIRCDALSIQDYASCEALATDDKDKVQQLIIGMDTEHATTAAVKYQDEALAEGAFERTLLVRWNRGLSKKFCFEVISRGGSRAAPIERFEYNDPEKYEEMERLAEEVGRYIDRVPDLLKLS